MIIALKELVHEVVEMVTVSRDPVAVIQVLLAPYAKRRFWSVRVIHVRMEGLAVKDNLMSIPVNVYQVSIILL